MKCIACGEEVVEDEHGCITGGHVTITFGFGSKNDMEKWSGVIHDMCAKSIQKLVKKEDDF